MCLPVPCSRRLGEFSKVNNGAAYLDPFRWCKDGVALERNRVVNESAERRHLAAPHTSFGAAQPDGSSMFGPERLFPSYSPLPRLQASERLFQFRVPS